MAFSGISVTRAPDALSDGKFPFAQNIRGYLADQVTSRPPWEQFQPPAAVPQPVRSLEPALGLYKILDTLYLEAVAIEGGLTANLGCSLIPFRPNESPAAWEYVFDSGQQVKILPNSAAPATSIIKKVGIAEPQLPCDALPWLNFQTVLFNVGGGAGSFTHSGTAGAPANGNRLTDVTGEVFADPLGGLTSVQVSSTVQYQKFQFLVNTTLGEGAMVFDVFPGAPQAVSIQAVYYFAGTSGHAILVPANLGTGPGDAGVGISQQQLLSSLRRGAILSLNNGVMHVENVYVWSVTEGPDGSVCIETSTVNTIAAGYTMTAVPAIQIGVGGFAIGQNLTSPDITFQVTAGIGSEAIPLPAAFFTSGSFSFRDNDRIHLSIQVDNPNNLISCRIAIDVSDGTFTKDYYYYEIRPSDLQGALTGVSATQLLQLAAGQLLGQRSEIDSEQATAYNNEIFSSTGGQLLPGGGSPLWTEVTFPISQLTRVGNDQTKTIANAVEFAFAVNCSATVNMAINSFSVFGGSDLDVGVGVPYQYRYRARDSSTGAASNWSPVMRYGVSPVRSQVFVILPGAFPDPQADTFDIERSGGALEDWTYAGSVLIGENFIDIYGDQAIAGNDTLPEDNYEPFPSIGPPLSTNVGGATLTGYIAILKFANSANPSFTAFQQLLPGNQLQVGQQVYTVYARPTFISNVGGVTTNLVQLVENAGSIVGATATVLEPLIANRVLDKVWGPDDNGCLHGVGDVLRPGGVYNTNPQNPDGCNEGVNFNELCAPTEPLINGALIQQTSCVASAIRWWAGRSSQDATGNLRYRYAEIPVGKGLAADFGICTDGNNIYFVGKDGIYAHSGGPAESLTDADLYPLFPHEGVMPGLAVQNIVYNGNTLYAPNYQQSQAFRLAVVNGFLYFDYLDSNNIYRTLTCNLRTRAWTVDTSALVANEEVTIHAGIPIAWSQFAGNFVPQLYAGDTGGELYVTNSNPGANSESVPVILCTREEIGDDVRAEKLFGDIAVDLVCPGGVTVTPVVLGVGQAGFAVVIAEANRTPGIPVELAGELLAQSMGLQFAWTDVSQPGSILFSWQASWVPQPETTGQRFTDWEGGPGNRNLFFQGFELEADTEAAAKIILVRDSDAQQTHAFQGPGGAPNTVNHNGQQTVPYSFIVPFQAHLVRLEPQDTVAWRKFRIRWITRPTPDAALNWIGQPTSYELPGYHHVHHCLFAYASTQPVILTVTTDGVAVPYNLPATPGGAYRKLLVMFKAVKGLVDAWSAVSAAPLQVWQEDIEIFVKAWGDPGPYTKARLLGAPMVPDADI